MLITLPSQMWTLDRAEAVKELRSIGASPVGCFDWYQRIGCVQELCDSFVAWCASAMPQKKQERKETVVV